MDKDLFDPNDFDNKILIKTVNNLNKFIDRNKVDKISSIINDLDELSKNPEFSVQALYILSLIAENFPDYISRENIESLSEFLKSENEKLRINAIIIIGFYLLEHVSDERVLTNRFLRLLRNSNKDIVENVIYFLRKLVEIDNKVIRNKLSLLIELALRDYKPEFVLEVLSIIEKYKIVFLSTAIRIRDALVEIIGKYEDKTLVKSAVQIISKIIPTVNNIELSRNFRKTLQETINDYILIKRHEISTKSGKIKELISDFKDKLKKTIKNEDIFYCYIKDQKKVFFIEFERGKVIKLLEKKKISIKNLQEMFSDVIENDFQIKQLVSNLIQFNLVDGYLSDFFFYPYNYMKQSVIDVLKENGVVSLNEYEFLEPQFVSKIFKDIGKDLKISLLFSKKQNKIYSLKGVIEEITKLASKESFIELKKYRGIFEDENFLKIVKNLPKGYLTDYHIRTSWLSNVGKTRIKTEIDNSKKIGYFDKNRVSEKLKIPKILIDTFTHSIFDSQLGFWDKFEEVFYYSMYIQDQIDQFKNLTDEKTKKLKVRELAKKLDVAENHIQLKIDSKFQELGEEIKVQDEISISKYMDKTGMDFHSFFNFINSLDLFYFKKGDNLYLNEKKITEIQGEIRKEIRSLSKSQSQISLGSFNIKSSIVREIIDDLKENEGLKGIFFEEDGEILFCTEKGIYNKIMETPDIIFIDQLFSGIELTEEEIELIEENLKSMIDRKVLLGKYDESTKTYYSFEIEFSTNYNDAIEQYISLIEYYGTIFERTFNSIRDVLIKTDDIIRPSEVINIQKSIDEINKSYVRWRTQLNAMNYKQTNIFLRQQGIGSKKDLEILPADRKNEIKNFQDDQQVNEADNNFSSWIKIFNELEINYGKIIFLHKRLQMKPEDGEVSKKLNDLYEYLDLK